MGYCAEALWPLLSLTETETVTLPLEEQVPVMAPVAGLALTPAGKPVITNWYGGVPPLTEIAAE